MLLKAIKDWQPDVVHCHNPGMAVSAALVTMRGHRPRSLVSVHGLPDEDYLKAARVLKWAGLPVVACGPEVAARLRAHGLKVVTTIQNAIGAPPPPVAKNVVMRSLGLPEMMRLVLSVGRLVPQKNQALTVRAIVGVTDAALVVVGDGPLRGELEALSRELGVEKRVVFAGIRSDARELIGASDAVIISSHWEGLPLVALEALASRTPLVATAVAGVRDLLRNGVDCLLVPPGNLGALTAAVRLVLSDGDLVSRLTNAGAALASTYREEAMIRSFEDLYQSLQASEPQS
jgi:glycosyltransferase involved in cell wall biosynthesis